MSHLEVIGVWTGVGVDVSKISESEQQSSSLYQERSRSLKKLTPLISGTNEIRYRKSVSNWKTALKKQWIHKKRMRLLNRKRED